MPTHRADTPSECSAASVPASPSLAARDDADCPGAVPVVMLRGKWLYRLGFPPRTLVRVDAKKGAITLSPAGPRSTPRLVAPDDFNTRPRYTLLEYPQETRALLDSALRCRFRQAAWRAQRSPSFLLQLLMQRYLEVEEDRFSLSLELWGHPERKAATMVARELVPPNAVSGSTPRWW